jgi:hypothetical protein
MVRRRNPKILELHLGQDNGTSFGSRRTSGVGHGVGQVGTRQSLELAAIG